MIIRKVVLHNVRSHRDSVIELGEGINVIYGDIGSGKSSILKAIEFALIGAHSGLSASEILRKGCREAKVTLHLEIPEEGVYVIERRLVKRGERYEEYVQVTDPRGGLHVFRSKEEARYFILNNILKIGEKYHARAEPLVFRTAFYVPQHELQRILVGRREEAKEVVRRLFQFHRYSWAKEVLAELKRLARQHRDGVLSPMITRLRGLLADRRARLAELDNLIKEREELRAKLDEAAKAHESILRCIDRVQQLLMEAERKLVELENVRRQRANIHEEIEKIRAELRAEVGSEDASAIRARLAELDEKERELTQRREALEKELTHVEARYEAMRREREALRKEIEQLEEGVSRAQDSVSNKRTIVKVLERELAKVKGLEGRPRCPTCDQPLSPEYVESLVRSRQEALEKARRELSQAEALLKQLVDRLHERRSALRELDRQMDKLARALRELHDRRVLLERELAGIAQRRERLKALLDKVERLRELREEERRLMEEESKLEPAEAYVGELRAQLEQLRAEEEKRRRAKEEIQRRLASVEARIKELEHIREEAAKLEKDLQAYETAKLRLEQAIRWLDQLERAIELAERMSFERVRQVLRDCFQRYASFLLQGTNIRVEIDEDLLPRVRGVIDGKEYAIEDPSGGERGSVALAYRLALNMTASMYIARRRGSFVIMDEPTENFSPERLRLLKAFLKECLGRYYRQYIIVTHHNELFDDPEFADRRIRLEKSADGVTHVHNVS